MQSTKFHAGLQQAFARYLVFDGDLHPEVTPIYGVFRFSIFLEHPPSFPVDVAHSKSRGMPIRASARTNHGFLPPPGRDVQRSAAPRILHARQFKRASASHPGRGTEPSCFRIDTRRKLPDNPPCSNQPWTRGPWVGFNCATTASWSPRGAARYQFWRWSKPETWTFRPDSRPTRFKRSIYISPLFFFFFPAEMFLRRRPLRSVFGSRKCVVRGPKHLPGLPITAPRFRCRIPKAGTENDDKNPPRVQSRIALDLANLATDNLLSRRIAKMEFAITVITWANKTAVFTFLSTIPAGNALRWTPRLQKTAELGFHFFSSQEFRPGSPSRSPDNGACRGSLFCRNRISPDSWYLLLCSAEVIAG